MDDLTLKATLRAAEQCDPPMFNAGGEGRILGKEALGQPRNGKYQLFNMVLNRSPAGGGLMVLPYTCVTKHSLR